MNREIRTVALFGDEDTGKSSFTRHGLRPGFSEMYGIPVGKADVGKPAVSYVLFESPKKGDDEGHVVKEGEDYRFVPAQMKDLTSVIVRNRGYGGVTIVDCGKELYNEFMSEMAGRAGSEKRLDLVVNMVRADASGMKPERVMANIKQVIAAGVPPERLAVVFNKSPAGVTVDELLAGPWAELKAHAEHLGYRIIGTALGQSFAVSGLRNMHNLTVETLAQGQTDYEAQAEELFVKGQTELAEAVLGMVDLQEGARSVAQSFRAVFAELVGLEVVTPVEA